MTGLVFLVQSVHTASYNSLANYQYSQDGNTKWYSQGLDTSSTSLYVDLPKYSVLANLLVINLPQLLLAGAALFYNNILTTMLLAAESCQYAAKRKGLRVSEPRGPDQRSTYWLQIPWKYGIPVLALNALMHWAVGRSIFLVSFDVYDLNGNAAPDVGTTAAGYSPVGILIAVIMGGVLILFLCGLSLRHLTPGMPVLGTCSLAISAACHPPRGDEDAGLKKLMYGVVGKSEDDDAGQSGPEHVTFTSFDVEPLQRLKLYH